MFKINKIPAWRAVCESWVGREVLDSEGTNTPVHQLYNAFICDNPDDYMDIGQFGKVLKARFPDRKRRRGKQGAQVYVYQDVALKDPSRYTFNSHQGFQRSVNNDKEDTRHRSLTSSPIVIGNKNIGPILVSIPEKTEAHFNGSSNITPSFQTGSSNTPDKIQDKMEDFNHLNPYTLRSKIQQENNPRGCEHFEIEIDSSQRDDSDEHLTIGKFGSKSAISVDSNSCQANNDNVNGIGEKICFTNGVTSHSFKDTDHTAYVECSEKEKSLESQSYVPSTNHFPTTEHKTHEFPVSDEATPGLTIDMSQFCIEQQLKSEIEVMDMPISDEYPELDEASVPQVRDNSELNAAQIDDGVSSSTQTDEKHPSTAPHKMAIGRQWLDANLKESPGARTTAKDIDLAYAQDHPDDPISGTSMAVLIRGKFPGRRKRIMKNNTSVYIYQDLELVNSKINTRHGSGVPIYPSTAVNSLNVQSKPYDTIYSSSPAVIVTQPNVNTIAVCSPPVNSIVNYQGLPYVALQVMPPMSSPQYEPVNFQSYNQNMNFRPSPVNVSQSLNLNHGISYILPNTSPAAIQPFKFTPVLGQNSSTSTVHPLKLSLAHEQNIMPTVMPPIRLPKLHRKNSVPAAYHPRKASPLRRQNSVIEATPSINIPSLQRPNVSPVKDHQFKINSMQGNAVYYEVPSRRPNNPQEEYVLDITKDKPSSTFNDDPNRLAKPSSSTSISPLLKVIKEEPAAGERNLLFAEEVRTNSSLYESQNVVCPSYGSEKVRKMMEAVLPDMDVDDYISSEISEASKIDEINSLNHKKASNFDNPITSLSSSSEYCYKGKKLLPEWRGQGKDTEVSSTAANLPLRAQNSAYQHEVITLSDSDALTNSPANQEMPLNLSLLNQDINKRLKKVWDEDIRKSLSGDNSGQKQINGKHTKKRPGNKKKVHFSENREQDVHMTELSNSLLRDSIINYNCQREAQEEIPSEMSLSARTVYTRIRDVRQRKNGEVRPIPFMASSVPAYPRSNENISQMQMTASRPNGNRKTTSFVSQPIYPNRLDNRQSSMPFFHDSHVQQTVSKVLETARYMLKDIGPSLSETEIAWRLEAALYEENPATMYTSGHPSAHCSSGNNPEALPCSVTPALKELTRSSIDFVDQLLHHQQSCQGLGCSEKCKTLRAAYTHLYIFRHRCQVWTTFTKIFSKHSRACRFARCPLPLCLFMKHELHLNGISVLPIQFVEERDILDEQFKRCEKTGPHNAELQCRHLQGENVAVSDPSNMMAATEEFVGLEGNSCVQDIKNLLEEAHHNNNRSQAVSRMLQVLTNMMKMHVQ